MRWGAAYSTHGEITQTRFWFENLKGGDPSEDRCGWEDNIRMDLTERGR
jgi:hypothetical protein